MATRARTDVLFGVKMSFKMSNSSSTVRALVVGKAFKIKRISSLSTSRKLHLTWWWWGRRWLAG